MIKMKIYFRILGSRVILLGKGGEDVKGWF